MKNHIWLSGFLFLIVVSGCATTDELRLAQARFDARLQELQEENVKERAEESEKLQKQINANRDSIKPFQKNEADTGADLIEIRDQLQKLRGRSMSFGTDRTSQKRIARTGTPS